MTARCPRCALSTAPDVMARCAADDEATPEARLTQMVACRDREISNLHAHLRKLTVKVERIGLSVNDLLEEMA